MAGIAKLQDRLATGCADSTEPDSGGTLRRRPNGLRLQRIPFSRLACTASASRSPSGKRGMLLAQAAPEIGDTGGRGKLHEEVRGQELAQTAEIQESKAREETIAISAGAGGIWSLLLSAARQPDAPQRGWGALLLGHHQGQGDGLRLRGVGTRGCSYIERVGAGGQVAVGTVA